MVPGLNTITRAMMERSPRLLIVAAHGVGYNNVDIAAADELGILVTNVPGANSDAVAEFAFGFMLTLVRFFPQVWEEMRREAGAVRISGEPSCGARPWGSSASARSAAG
ncbi:MAG: hypothetical protein MZU91_11985 [Desulfosudis oleivorans]|nr:hypothetical protein [Desulfosudis oleivorans]